LISYLGNAVFLIFDVATEPVFTDNFQEVGPQKIFHNFESKASSSKKIVGVSERLVGMDL
jgi:hypothetical protein